MKYKSSFYNILIPVPEKDKYLLYNTLREGFCEIEKELGIFLQNLGDNDNIDLGTLPNDTRKLIIPLIENRYLVESQINERLIFYDRYQKFRKQQITKSSVLGLTILPTLDCNLDCRYCFQSAYRGRVMTEKTMTQIITFIEGELTNQKVAKDYKRISLTWFGGEPLLNRKLIKEFSSNIIQISNEYRLHYDSSIITNGTLLTSVEAWNELIENKITDVQITLDGPKLTHDYKRPYKRSSTKSSYDQIISNIKKAPKTGINIVLRINCDKSVYSNMSSFLDDLIKHEIWPHRKNQLKIDLAKTSIYESIQTEEERDIYFDSKEYFYAQKEFRLLKLEKYNAWAKINGEKPGRLKFILPKVEYVDCMSAVCPSGFVIDPEGFIHKCWELVDKKERRLQHISQEIDLDNSEMKRWLSFDKMFSKEECKDCKILPICGFRCPLKTFEDKINFSCSKWKYLLEEELREQYIMLHNEPQKIAFVED